MALDEGTNPLTVILAYIFSFPFNGIFSVIGALKTAGKIAWREYNKTTKGYTPYITTYCSNINNAYNYMTRVWEPKVSKASWALPEDIELLEAALQAIPACLSEVKNLREEKTHSPFVGYCWIASELAETLAADGFLVFPGMSKEESYRASVRALSELILSIRIVLSRVGSKGDSISFNLSPAEVFLTKVVSNEIPLKTMAISGWSRVRNNIPQSSYLEEPGVMYALFCELIDSYLQEIRSVTLHQLAQFLGMNEKLAELAFKGAKDKCETEAILLKTRPIELCMPEIIESKVSSLASSDPASITKTCKSWGVDQSLACDLLLSSLERRCGFIN